MRLSYTDIQNQFLRNIGLSGSTNATVIGDFNLNLGQRYQLILAKMQDYTTTQVVTSTTVANQQYYHYPVGTLKVDKVYITIGSVKYPLDVITSTHSWTVLNAIQIQASAIPQFIFPRRDDFGIWPIPQAPYTITFNYFIRDRNLTTADYTSGTIDLTNGAALVSGNTTSFIPDMVGRWLTVTSDVSGKGYWYRIATYTSPTSLSMDNNFDGLTGTGLSYKIGESPEIPEEGHVMLIDGTTADFFAGLRSDVTKATWFNNKFWTGDGNNANRDEGIDEISGGLIALMRKYSGRNTGSLVRSQQKLSPLPYKVFAQSIT